LPRRWSWEWRAAAARFEGDWITVAIPKAAWRFASRRKTLPIKGSVLVNELLE
jgi:hypothetical protein